MVKMDVENNLKKLLSDKYGIAEHKIIREVSLGDTGLGLDSLDSLELIMDIENDYCIEIPDKDVEDIKTFGDLVDYAIKKDRE